jgi:hypothetical protein
MTALAWRLVDGVARLLAHDEREVVLGDLEERDEGAWRGLLDVSGLVMRREAGRWASWEPWFAGFGVTVPGSFLLMGVSLSVSLNTQQLFWGKFFPASGPAAGIGPLPLTCSLVLLTLWSWTGGFVLGAVSRRTIWASAALCFLPCLFCLVRFRLSSLSRACLFLFLLPAIAGVLCALRRVRVSEKWAVALAIAATALVVPAWLSRTPWIGPLDGVLSLPAWYLVASAMRLRPRKGS